MSKRKIRKKLRPLRPQEKIMYCVWVSADEEDEEDEDSQGYWCLYDTIKDALKENGHKAEIFRFIPESMGTYSLEPKLISDTDL